MPSGQRLRYKNICSNLVIEESAQLLPRDSRPKERLCHRLGIIPNQASFLARFCTYILTETLAVPTSVIDHALLLITSAWRARLATRDCYSFFRLRPSSAAGRHSKQGFGVVRLISMGEERWTRNPERRRALRIYDR